MTPVATVRAPALLLAAVALAALLAASGFTASAQSGPVEKNCTPPADEREWVIENSHVVCVGRDITVSELRVWKASTVELHDVNLYLDTVNTPEGKATVAVGADLEGYALPSKLIIKDSYVEALDPSLPQRIDLLSHAEFQFSDSTLTGLGHGLTFGKTNTGVISSSTFINMEFGITDGGATNLAIQDNFFDQVDHPIYTEGTPLIEGNAIVNCELGVELRGDSAHPVIRENTITACRSGIVQVQSQSPQGDVYHNDVFENCGAAGGGANIWIHGKAEDNWWGANSPSVEELNRKYNCIVEPSNPTPADYSPWLTSPRHPERLPTPAIASLPSSVARGQVISFDASGSQPSTEFGFPLASYEWIFGDGASLSGQQVSHAYQDLGSYTVKLHVKDAKGLGHFVERMVQVVNRDLVISGDVEPQPPRAGEDLRIDAEATDSGGGSVAVVYDWIRNGAYILQDTTATTMGGSNIRVHDTWEVVVKATDEHGGTASSTYAVTIPNRLPVVDSVSLQPGMPKTGDDIAVSVTGHDPDGHPVSYSYEWFKNNAKQGGQTGASLDSVLTKKGESWRVRVTPSDDYGAGASKEASVVIQNTAPTASGASIQPEQPKATSTLQALASGSDVDGDALSWTYKWYRNNALQPDLTTSSVPSPRISKGDSWRVEATPSDGTANGSPVSSSVSIQNSAPRVESLALQAGQAGTPIEAVVEAVDVDGDAVALTYSWSQNGQIRSDMTGSSVPGVHVVSGDSWRVTVTPSDGTSTGEPVSAQTVVGNDAPLVESLIVSPTTPTASTPLHAAVIARDPNPGDEVAVSFQWLRNNEATDETTDTVPASRLVKGDSWRVQVTVTDGKSDVVKLSSVVVIQNTPPTITQTLVTPTMPVVDSSVELSVEAADADGDSLTVSWALPDGSTHHGTSVSTTLPGPGVVEIPYTITDGEAEVTGSLMVTVQAAPEPEESEDTQEATPSPGDVDSGNDHGNLGLDATGENSKEVGGTDDDALEGVDAESDKQAPLPGFVGFLVIAAVIAARRRT